MNRMFLVIFLLFFVATVMFDQKQLRPAKKTVKFIYYSIGGVTLALYFCAMFNFDIPMPTRFVVQNVAPWIYSLVKPY